MLLFRSTGISYPQAPHDLIDPGVGSGYTFELLLGHAQATGRQAHHGYEAIPGPAPEGVRMHVEPLCGVADGEEHLSHQPVTPGNGQNRIDPTAQPSPQCGMVTCPAAYAFGLRFL